MMAFKLKTMFEAKMKMLLGDDINVGKEEELPAGTEELNATGEIS